MTMQLSLQSMPNLSLASPCPRSFCPYVPLPQVFRGASLPVPLQLSRAETPAVAWSRGGRAPFLWGYSEYYSIITALFSVTTIVKQGAKKNVKKKSLLI